ncbi:hypothetical protein LEM8419_02223 [Neolewinella maritima]|uniref:DUF421 domain-containing protein n=1 Tax=Neolewinella maritima TaxID=1383882 RepID=A0ABN8F8N1_9BACT|nr:YetF domain-containing protein [Neolewinella maritima]CAH1001322.1 hypothetical protein LEM8419_02223 [Neolewinella maritima]
MGETVFFDNWQDILQIGITAPIVYVFIVLAIRLTGKRSTSQMNNFDWVVTVAIGSIAASGIMLKDLSITETLFAISLLLLLQYLLTSAVRNNESLESVVKAQPTLLVHDGQFLEEPMKRERITRSEIMSALRNSGITDVRLAQWVILEPDATFSVIRKSDTPLSKAALAGVEVPED